MVPGPIRKGSPQTPLNAGISVVKATTVVGMPSTAPRRTAGISITSRSSARPAAARWSAALVSPESPTRRIMMSARASSAITLGARPPESVPMLSVLGPSSASTGSARARVPIIVHTIHGPSFGPFQGPIANLLFRAAERCAARVTTHFVVVADAMKRQYLNAGIGRTDQYTKIFSGFPLEPFLASTNDLQLRASLGLTPDNIVVGKIARLFK